MKAIVTGATGGLGRNLCQYLEKNGWQVIALGRNLTIGAQLNSDQIKFRVIDLTNKEFVEKTIEEADVLFHCAALSSPWGKYEQFFANNVLATEYLLSACEEKNISRFVHISTSSVYFDFHDRLNISEESKLADNFANHYAKTKFLAEEAIRNNCSRNLTKVILRPRGVFGEHDQVLIPRLMRVARKGRFPLINGGKAVVDITYVQNVVRAMMLAATKPLPDYSLFNISNGEPWEFEPLIRILTNKLNISCHFFNISYQKMAIIAGGMEWLGNMNVIKEPPLTSYTVGLLANSQTLDISKAREQLGYHPKYTIEEGIDRYVKWCRSEL